MERFPIETPAFIYDIAQIETDCMRVAKLARESGCHLLFAVKALSIAGVLELISQFVDGFSASSLFEVQLIRKIFGSAMQVHATVPGLRMQDFPSVDRNTQYLNFNSISQFKRFAPKLGNNVRAGIRVNPGLSLISDVRYNPSRPHSKLGASLPEIVRLIEQSTDASEGPSGLLIHNNCDSEEFSGLFQTVKHVDSVLDRILPSLDWINLGGGYIFGADEHPQGFVDAVAYLRSRYKLEIFIEPGASLVRSGMQLIASVVDLFDSDGKTIAILDTSVNHMPEVFEYQDTPDSEPWVLGHVDDGRFAYLLAGCTCLAGDIFGEYAFNTPLAIGDQIVFPELGAYTIVKANRFNGINLPNIYAKSSSGQIMLKHHFTFSDYAVHNAMRSGGR